MVQRWWWGVVCAGVASAASVPIVQIGQVPMVSGLGVSADGSGLVLTSVETHVGPWQRHAWLGDPNPRPDAQLDLEDASAAWVDPCIEDLELDGTTSWDPAVERVADEAWWVGAVGPAAEVFEGAHGPGTVTGSAGTARAPSPPPEGCWRLPRSGSRRPWPPPRRSASSPAARARWIRRTRIRPTR
jgi:hypothetical protein